MLLHCLKCKKIKKLQNLTINTPKATIQNLQKEKAEERCFYQNVQCVIVKNQNLPNSKKLVDYWVEIKTPLIKIPLIGSFLF